MTDQPVRISIEGDTDAAGEVRTAVNAGLYSYNDQFAGPMENATLTISARHADGTVIGGLVAGLQPPWKWMHVDRLWIAEPYRRAGVGRRLLEAAEKEAQKRGCVHVGTSTFEFQARAFYEKQGYIVYGVQEDYPVGHRKFLLRKKLQA
jgi:GNAT superfamily N-acetyltransferase